MATIRRSDMAMRAPETALKPPPPAQLRPTAPIVPPGSIVGRAFVAVVAIMSFLACITIGAVVGVTEAAREWQSDILREVTIQVRPLDGIDVEREVARAADLARRTPGIGAVRVLTRAENERLLRPWLGEVVGLDALPVPRLVVVAVDRARLADLTRLRETLARDVRGATLDDHRHWRERLAATTRTIVVAGIGVLALVLLATALSVAFATRGAIASNREIVEVLHLVGADDRFITRTFSGRFLRLGLEGGAAGGVAALTAIHVLGFLGTSLSSGAGEVGNGLLVGAISIGFPGYLGIAATLLVVAAVTALTSAWTVRQHLARLR